MQTHYPLQPNRLAPVTTKPWTSGIPAADLGPDQGVHRMHTVSNRLSELQNERTRANAARIV
jgi:hypothetical protein